jgi:putative DNA primase/helicase
MSTASPNDSPRLLRAEASSSPLEPTDLANARLLAERHGDRLRHVGTRGRHGGWLAWDERLWEADATGEAARAAKEVADHLLEQARDPSELAWALTSAQAHGIADMLELAASEPSIAIRESELDGDAWAFTTGNGTLDLRTGELRPHDPADLISRGTRVPYDPDAAAPRWTRFLEEVFDGDAELAGYVQRLAGYSMTGLMREHVLHVLHGSGRNGKGAMVRLLGKAFGTHSMTSPFSSFTRSTYDGRSPRDDLARLAGSRVVFASESSEGKRLDEAVIKGLTGGDTITARHLYGRFFEFEPTFTIWLIANHKPRADASDEAMWARLRLIPFNVSFLGREDRELDDKLEAELPGVLAWCVAGCLSWQERGLDPPDVVLAATASYRRDEDVVGRFLEERCRINLSALETPPGERLSEPPTTTVGRFRDAYEQWCRERGEEPLAPVMLGRELAKRGVISIVKGRERVYQGVSVLAEQGRR